MRGLVLALALMLAVLLGSAWSSGNRRTEAITSLRVCGAASYSDGACRADQSSQTIDSYGVGCSFSIAESSTGSAVAYWHFDGDAPEPLDHYPLHTVRIRYAAGVTTTGTVSLSTGSDLALPGGTYTCVVIAGSDRATGSITSAGATEPIVDAAACASSDAAALGSPVDQVCIHDDSAKAIPAGRAGNAVCSAIARDQVGLAGSVTMLREGQVVGTRAYRINSPLGLFEIVRPTPSAPTPLFPGSYECRFVIGTVTVTKTFTVVNGKPSPTDATVQVLRELSELHVTKFNVRCIPYSLLTLVFSPDPRYVVLGMARVKGTSMYLDNQRVCAPLAGFAATPPGTHPSHAVLLALSVVAHEYGHTLGMKQENKVECFAAEMVWKWVRRGDFGPAYAAQASAYLLDNRRRPPAYKLVPGCRLTP